MISTKRSSKPLKRNCRYKKADIKPIVEEEIVNKYYFTPGRVESMLRNDLQLHKALECTYSTILPK